MRVETQDSILLEEFNDFYSDFPSIKHTFKLIQKIGEGTFSSVYKAVDLNHHSFDNSKWCLDHDTTSVNSTCGLVALKRIYVTSSPERIINELAILHCLNGHRHIAPIISALRYEDQVVAVLPYFPHEDFRDYYLDLQLDEIKCYMKALLSGMSHVHKFQIIHRDIKPSNFLYNRQKRTGVLVDFGLAQLESKSSRNSKTEISSSKKQKNASSGLGYLIEDPRPSLRANRAGTRGFRAPEVLFKVASQTIAIDMWSVGVILLCILSSMFPFFASNDDAEAIMEISHIFGKQEMEKLASSLNRAFYTNLPSIEKRHSLKEIACHFNPSRKDFPEEIFDLLDKMMTLDSKKRITAQDALLHPFFDDLL